MTETDNQRVGVCNRRCLKVQVIEALRIARQIIETAERERMEVADWEAMRGLQWDDDDGPLDSLAEAIRRT
jgi:hypothetical protein